MSLILTRSPYFVGRGELDSDAIVKLEIGSYSVGSFTVSKTYNLTFRDSFLMDISPLLRDWVGDSYSYFSVFGRYFNISSQNIMYCRITISGSENGVPVADAVSEAFFTDGYLFSSEDEEYESLAGPIVTNIESKLVDNNYYANSNNIIYKLDDSNVRFNLLKTDVNLLSSPSSETINVDFRNNNESVYNTDVVFDYTSSSASSVLVKSLDYASYKDRVLSDSGVLESNKCLDRFLRNTSLQPIDEIYVSANNSVKIIKVKTISECKHNPYRVTFKNRYGVDEDLWFFKRSDTSINIKKESFRSNSLGRYSAREGVKTMTSFNTNGMERITLNSGFVEEEMNEAFRQLLLSEEVTLYDYKENKTYNVNLGTSELQYKQHVNDKLINYTIEFEFAHEVINNVG